ncbi:imelysin family protein [Marinospirillum sp.]|uniref:imelysin family protein n=1 Tax=Marinospirillum sp. TaxID=2183934 RepID=UPI00286FBD57|nr:imelysin family protein [Marinospirillum sp.]MDR9469398.1 imelysin family protein [Marinospirillum sp.]
MKVLPHLLLAAGLTGLVTLTGCQSSQDSQNQAATPKAVLDTYADIAEAGYTDSVITAKALKDKIQALLDEPSKQNLQTAREAWLASRVPYQQTEVYRFGNAIVDDWEGKVNAWPLDEGLIDYVDTASYGEEFAENPYYTANVIANPTLTVGNSEIDAREITPELLAETLHEIDAVEANVATGYHAIEFLLWGQDLHGTNPGAGERPATDFSLENCTGGNCDRRRDYLMAATDLLISDLEDMADNWAEGGEARQELAAKGTDGGLATILTGMGSLSYGELAGERTQLGLMLHDPEEEHDCFSDNTHNSHYYDALGIRNVYLGEYTRVDGSVVKGASLSDLVAAEDQGLDEQLRKELDASVNAGMTLVSEAKEGNTFDVLIAAGNQSGNAIVQTFVDELKTQTGSIEKAIATLGLSNIELEGSDSLDNPGSVM